MILGEGAVINNGTELCWHHGGGTIEIGNSNFIGPDSLFNVVYGGKLTLGNNIWITRNLRIDCYKNVTIGDRCLFGWDIQIHDTNHHCMVDLHSGEIKPIWRPSYISDDCWIGHNVTFRGGRIPSCCTVASHSYVNKDFTSNPTPGLILVGMPAKVAGEGKMLIRNHYVEERIKKALLAGELPRLQDLDANVCLNPAILPYWMFPPEIIKNDSINTQISEGEN